MKKSVYSLVLSDQVIVEIDKLAYAEGISRSSYINKLLAREVCYITPEKRMSEILCGIETTLGSGAYRVTQQRSEAMISIGSPIQYKYRPVVRYSVELYGTFDKTIGKLRVAIRTQSKRLIEDMESFFGLWTALEASYHPTGIVSTYADGRLTRTLCLPDDKTDRDNEAIAATICEYIEMFDEILKVYFADIENGTAETSVRGKYREWYEKGLPFI